MIHFCLSPLTVSLNLSRRGFSVHWPGIWSSYHHFLISTGYYLKGNSTDLSEFVHNWIVKGVIRSVLQSSLMKFSLLEKLELELIIVRVIGTRCLESLLKLNSRMLAAAQGAWCLRYWFYSISLFDPIHGVCRSMAKKSRNNSDLSLFQYNE